MLLEHRFTVPAPLPEVWAALLDPHRVAPCMPGATLTEVIGDAFTGTVKVKVGPISLLYKGNGQFLERDERMRRLVIKASGKDSRGNGTAAATVTVTLTAEGDSTSGTVNTDLAITGKPAQFGRGLIAEVGGKILTVFADCLADKLAAPPAADVPAPIGSVQAGSATEGLAEPDRTDPAVGPPDEPAETADSATAEDTPAVGPPDRPAEAAAAEEPRTGEPEPVAGAGQRPLRVVPEAEPVDLLELAGPSVAKRAVPVLAAVVALVLVLLIRRRWR
ncbi:SRPBCC family protein [Actinokineospora globicatena]|uniref:SRPBCC family protein n=1 Tax=Actinokineospora globicatena TaxID=103729 RepID=UPI0020A47209|nr:SRPBCC family protein [Actinokineospora globicatena]MCP2300808.1 Carbon monoxide dehydrogenase subunit G [Actinokineospora globicatena]GLW77567.1 carbon monoxide dehydrogenase subunit G [Actinokineospora globicatena]GLW84401.1 carbon monoxide dehydrogenase subunit G [Actinokineospora globicatena]